MKHKNDYAIISQTLHQTHVLRCLSPLLEKPNGRFENTLSGRSKVNAHFILSDTLRSVQGLSGLQDRHTHIRLGCLSTTPEDLKHTQNLARTWRHKADVRCSHQLLWRTLEKLDIIVC